MQEHKFIAGQSVRSPGTTSTSLYGHNIVLMPAGIYDIVRTMPMLAGKLQYRVRSSSDGHERVVVEDDLCPEAETLLMSGREHPSLHGQA